MFNGYLHRIIFALAVFTSLHSHEVAKTTTIYDIGNTITIPIYPRIATDSGQSGELIANIQVKQDGSCKVIDIHGKSKILVESMRKAMAFWTFLPRDTVHLLEIRVDFVLLPSSATDSELVSEVFPVLNKIIIKSRRPCLEGGIILDHPPLTGK